MQTIRGALKSMGEAAGVEIEPEEQSVLLQNTLTVPGVWAAGVPGAGGRDAVFVLVLSQAARERVEQLWSNWHWGDNDDSDDDSKICPLLLTAADKNAGVLIDPTIVW